MSILHVCLLVAALALSGCDEIEEQVEAWRYKGTHVGVQKCIDRKKTETTALATIRATCAAAHEKTVPVSLAGRASYSWNFGDQSWSFKGHVKNTSPNYIVTAFTIDVTHDDMREGQQDAKSFSGLWIEPDKSYSFAIEGQELTFQPKLGRLRDGDKFFYDWHPSEPRGIEITAD
jgi:hypothetical protein